MRLEATRPFYSVLLLSALWFVCAPTLAFAQPADDPGFSEPAPPPRPAPKPAPAPTPPPAPPQPKVAPRPAQPLPPPPPPPYQAPEMKETIETQVTYTNNDKAPIPADTEMYERLAAPTLSGPVGLFRTLTGDSGKTNTFRVGLHVAAFAQDSFLIAGNGSLKGDSNSRFTGDLTIGYTPWKYLETYLSLFNTSNKNQRTDVGRTDPEVILSLGDLALGVKGHLPVASFVDLGLHLGVRFLNSVSGISFDGSSTNFAVDAIASFDLRHAAATHNVPLRFHINFGFLLDNSISLLPAGQCGKSTGNDPCIRSRVVETFAYGIGSDRLKLAFAVDAPVLLPRNVGLEPFFEYHMDASVGDGDRTLYNALKGDKSIPSDRLQGNTQQYLTFGIRIRPVAGLVLDTGLDIGLQSPGFVYGPPVPQWNIIFGAVYAYGQSPRGRTKIITKTVTRETARGPVTGKVRGIVRDSVTKKPLANAVVHYTNRRETPQVTTEDGTFVSYGFTVGGVSIEVTRDDYNPTRVEANSYAGGETPVEVFMVAKPPTNGTLKAHVSDSSNQPVSATVRFTSANGSIVDADTDGPGAFVARLPQGDYTMDVVATGYLAKQLPVLVNSAQSTTVDVQLTKKPTVSHVTLGKTEIQVKGVVHFGTNDAIIKPDGEQLLDEVADVIIRNPQLKKIRIEGHTDNRGNAQKNLELSTGRAAAVKAYLSKVGVDPNRLEAQGFGATQPLVPNLTPANRARNRRVAFKIVDLAGGIPLE